VSCLRSCVFCSGGCVAGRDCFWWDLVVRGCWLSLMFEAAGGCVVDGRLVFGGEEEVVVR
jgi:hypothetical protein